MRAGRRHLGTRIGCAAIVGAAAVALGWQVRNGYAAAAFDLAPAQVRSWEFTNQQQECIYHAIRSELPKDATVYVDDDVTYYAQKLAELSTLWAVPEPRPALAQWTMSLAAGKTCSGLALKVRRR